MKICQFANLAFLFLIVLWLCVPCVVCLTKVSIVLQAVKNGDTIFIGQYLFTGSETTSVWLEVMQSWVDQFKLQYLSSK